jgi:hypothetical protein
MTRVRRVLCVATVATILGLARPAAATGVCDPDGHFCIQVDTTSAHVCDVLATRGLDRTECQASDLELRDKLRHHDPPPVRALVIRYEDEQVFVEIDRHKALPELEESQLEEHARWMRSNVEERALDAFRPVRIVRVNGVQAVRFDWEWTENDTRFEVIGVEVRALPATYSVLFQGTPGTRLAGLAEAAIATIDALPMERATGPGEAVTWLLRALAVAAVLVGVAWWIGRRRGRRPGIDARDLWPR